MPSAKIKISARQFMLLKLSGILGTIVFVGIRGITGAAGSQGYLAVLAGGAFSFIVLTLSILVGRRFPTQTPFEYSKSIFGKWIGSFLMLVLIVTTLAAGALITRALGDFLITAILPDTPLSANIGLMLVLVCVGAYMGLEALARFNELFAPLVLIAWVTVALFAIPKIDFGWFSPLFDISVGKLASATLVAATLLTDGLIELIFYPFVTDKKIAFKYVTWAVISATAVVLILQIAVIGVYSPSLAISFAFPILQLAQDATLGVFLQRLEAIFLAVWIIGTFIRVAVVFYSASLGMAQTLGVKNHRYFILPLAAGAYYLAFSAGNVPESFNYDAIFLWISIIVQLGTPSLLLIGSLILHKKG